MFNFLDVQPVKQPVKLGFGDGVGITLDVLRKSEFTFLDSLVKQTEAVLIPVEYLDLVAVTVVKNEHRIRKRVKPELLLHDRR